MALEIGLKGGNQGCRPASAGQGVGLVLAVRGSVWPYAELRRFAHAIPLRRVGPPRRQRRRLRSGIAVRRIAGHHVASSPFCACEHQWDGAGGWGLTNNLPVDVVKGMGADYTIAVALDLPSNPADFQSLLGVAGSSISYMITEKERTQMAAADLVVMPVLKGLKSAEYTRLEEFRKIGYEAAERKAQMLKQFQVSEEEYLAYAEVRRAKRVPVTFIRTRSGSLTRCLRNSVATLSKSILPVGEDTLDQKHLEEQLLKLTGTAALTRRVTSFLENRTRTF